ncbi:hypothetical protein ACIPWY_29690 [Streptomyces sp. NPDC090032]|uniref:hypothetical protein n=1 Tax=Streptomyces sp. NPDC090032 TaxID=3365925 RepID=UPI0038090B1F
MEQRIDTQKVTPVDAAGADPASVPGLIPPRQAPGAERPEKALSLDKAEPTEMAEQPDAEPDPASDSIPESDSEPESESDSEFPSPAWSRSGSGPLSPSPSPSPSAPDADSEAAEDPADAPAADETAGPDFTASDRRGSITADATGVRLQLDDQEAEFYWSEIGAVEVGTSRRRLTVTVHTPDSRWYPNDVEAPDKARAQQWADELDKVLDAYFED